MKSTFTILLFGLLIVSCKTTKPSTTTSGLKANSDVPEYHRTGMVTPSNYKAIVGDTLKVLSWNVEHFIDGLDNPYTNNKREDTGDRMEGRVALLVEALKVADADIVVLQEFEHVQFLKSIADEYLPTMGYQFFADHESPNWYMNVVVMSRVPLGILYGYGAVTTPVAYKAEGTGKATYETQSRINTRLWSIDVLVNDDYSFLLTGVHLKAGGGSRNVAMRKGQIQFLKGQFERFLHENPNRNMLLVGDFNATPDSEELQLLTHSDTPALFVDNLPETTYSHPAKAPKWRIDHVLPNVNMQAEYVQESMEVRYFFDKTVQDNLSDHLPVMAKFLTKDQHIAIQE